MTETSFKSFALARGFTLPVDTLAVARSLNMNPPPPISMKAVMAASVPAPAFGLGSYSNYLLNANCASLINVAVAIDVTQDIVWKSSSKTSLSTEPDSIPGFSFQLNAFSPKNYVSAYQQYAFALQGTQLSGVINNYTATSTSLGLKYINLLTLPNTSIPAGYKLTISLVCDATGNVTGVTFLVVDNQGKTQANQTETLSAAGFTDFAPIIAFELDLVGPGDADSVVLSSGAGSIGYVASNGLTALNAEPPCVGVESSGGTAEQANSVYGTLPASPASPGTWLTQNFDITTGASMVIRPGPYRPALPFASGRLA